MNAEIARQLAEELQPVRRGGRVGQFGLHGQPGQSVACDQEIDLAALLVSEVMEIEVALAAVRPDVAGLQDVSRHEVLEPEAAFRDFASTNRRTKFERPAEVPEVFAEDTFDARSPPEPRLAFVLREERLRERPVRHQGLEGRLSGRLRF
jgi:hypothetical protein